MRLAATLYCYILLCLCICVSNGAPPKEVGARPFDIRLHKYTEEEDKLIVEELSQLIDSPKSLGVWNKIREKHNDKWKKRTPGFPQERSISGLRNRFLGVLIDNRQHAKVKVPETLKKKYNRASLNKTDPTSSKSIVSNGLIDSQVTDEELDDYLRVDKTRSDKARYIDEEDDFIIDELTSLNDSEYVHSNYVWENIAENYRRKLIDGTPGFTTARSAGSLYGRFRYLLRSKNKAVRAKVPENVMQKFINSRSGEIGTVSKPRYTEEEDKFIIQELLNPSVTSLFGSSTLRLLRAEHDKKREAKIPGFEQVRTARSLGGRINTMKSTGQLPNDIEEKFQLHQSGASSSTPSYTHHRQETYAEDAEMVEELLNNSEYEIDFSNFFSSVEE